MVHFCFSTLVHFYISIDKHALNVIGSINRTLVTDQDFADAEKAVKWCKNVEERLEAAKQHALSQTESINVLFNAIDEISEEAKATRLELDKLIKSMKENRKLQIKQAAESALAEHITTLNDRFKMVLMPIIKADFALVIKGKRTIDSIQNAIDTELAQAKIKANEIAEVISSNLDVLNQEASNYSFLFKDIQSIVLKSKDDFALLVKSRIAEYEANQAEKTKQQPKVQEVIAETKQEAKPVVIEQPEPEQIQPKQPTTIQIPAYEVNKYADRNTGRFERIDAIFKAQRSLYLLFEYILKDMETNKLYSIIYKVGATESQPHSELYSKDEFITATEVKPVEVITIVYQPV